MSSFTFEPLISPALWIALALLAVATTAWYARSRPLSIRRGRWAAIVALWATAIASVLVILLNPTWLEPVDPPTGKPQLTILLDQSPSMGVDDAPGGHSRFAEGVEITTAHAAELARRFDVKIRTFAEGSLPAQLEQLPSTRLEGLTTDLSGALGTVLTGDRGDGQAVLMISDGIHNAVGGMDALRQTLQTARAMDVPIYTMTIGGPTVLRDLELSLARPQELSFVGQNVPVPVVVRQRGRLSDRAEVTLLKEGRPLASETVQLAADGSAPVRFHVTEPVSGLYRYEVRVAPLTGEATEGNNSATFLLRVIDNPVRVLLLEGKPYWDAKFLIRTFAADPSVELDAIVRMTDSRYVKRSIRLSRSEGARPDGAGAPKEGGPPAGGEEIPVDQARRTETSEVLHDISALINDEAALASYQLLVLGRDAEAFLSDAMVERLREWVSHDGGALVCYRGSPVATANQNLARLLPVRWTPSRETRFRMQLTERGSELDWLSAATGGGNDILAKLPSLASFPLPDRPKPQSVVLVRSQDEQGPAVVTYQPYGTGRVVSVEGAGMWRWAFLAPQFQKHDQAYTALWQSLLRWLVSGVGLIPGQDVVLRSDKVAYNISENVSTMLLMRPEAERAGVPKVELRVGDGSTVGEFTPVPLGDEPGVFRVSMGILPEGNYQAAAILHGGAPSAQTSATVAFDVRSFSSEQLDVKARPDVMARIASETSGAVLTGESASTLSEQFEKHQASSRPRHIRRLTAWDRTWVLLGIVAIWSISWGLRRSAGLT